MVTFLRISMLSATALFALFTTCLAFGPSTSAAAKSAFAKPGIRIYFDSNGATLRYCLTLQYPDATGGSFDRTTSHTVHARSNSYFISAPFGGSEYAPSLKQISVDTDREARVCAKAQIDFSNAKPVTTGSTSWKKCTSDFYRSCSFFRCTCKGEGGVSVVAFDGTNLLVPSGGSHITSCASPHQD